MNGVNDSDVSSCHDLICDSGRQEHRVFVVVHDCGAGAEERHKLFNRKADLRASLAGPRGLVLNFNRSVVW